MRKRFKFSYTHHAVHFLSMPISVFFMIQICSPTLLGLCISASLLIVLIITIIHSFTLKTINYGNRYFIVITPQNILLSVLAIFCNFEMYAGSLLMVMLMNFYLWTFIFQDDKSKWKQWWYLSIDCCRLVIVLSLIVN